MQLVEGNPFFYFQVDITSGFRREANHLEGEEAQPRNVSGRIGGVGTMELATEC